MKASITASDGGWITISSDLENILGHLYGKLADALEALTSTLCTSNKENDNA